MLPLLREVTQAGTGRDEVPSPGTCTGPGHGLKALLHTNSNREKTKAVTDTALQRQRSCPGYVTFKISKKKKGKLQQIEPQLTEHVPDVAVLGQGAQLVLAQGILLVVIPGKLHHLRGEKGMETVTTTEFSHLSSGNFPLAAKPTAHSLQNLNSHWTRGVGLHPEFG